MAFRDSYRNIVDNLRHPYSFAVRNEENLAEEGRIRFTVGWLAALTVFLMVLLGVLVYFASASLAPSSLKTQSLQNENRQLLTQLAQKTDSLEQRAEAYREYILNLNAIFSGRPGIYPGSTKLEGDSMGQNPERAQLLSPEEKALREEFESQERSSLLTVRPSKEGQLSKMMLFHPVEGIISSRFDPSIGHYGVDLVSKKNEPVKAVAAGAVIMASWTEDAGYVIAIQHEHNLLSVYKHNSALLKKLGDQVKGGEIVSIMGNSGKVTSGPHLHFELWQEGEALDPAQYLSF